MERPHVLHKKFHRLVPVLLAVAAFTPLWPSVARADVIPEVSASIDNPDPNPVPAGSTAATTAFFSLSGDTGPIRVQIQLDAPAGYGSLRLDLANTSSELTGCLETGLSVICQWDGDSSESPQTLGVFIDVDSSVAADTEVMLHAVVESPSASPEIYATAYLYSAPPVGTTSLSGVVVTNNGVPVNQACIFILATGGVFVGITDSNGEWSVGGLPDDYSFAVGIIPPFVGTYGPCAENGPPPVSAAGELQPVFAGDVWIDLEDPYLTGGLGDPFVFATNAGATIFFDTTSGIEACLTNAPGSQVPRPPCQLAATTTSSSTPTSTTSDVGAGQVTTTTELETLPFTGLRSATLVAIGSLIVLVGMVLIVSPHEETS